MFETTAQAYLELLSLRGIEYFFANAGTDFAMKEQINLFPGKYAVKRATLAIYPDGWAARTDRFPLSDLAPTARYEKICEAFGGYGERVDNPGQMEAALKRALHAVKNEKRQALLNIICKHP